MQKKRIDLLDTVALLEDLPQRNLERGEVGTVVEFSRPKFMKLSLATTTDRHTHSLL